MNILVAASCYDPYVKGGGEISTRLLAEGLTRFDHNVSVLTVHDKMTVTTECKNGFKIYRIPSPNIYWSYDADQQGLLKKGIWHLLQSYNVFSSRYIKPIVDHVSPDVFHTSTLEDISPYAWKIANNYGATVVHTLRSYVLICPFRHLFRNKKVCKSQCFDCRVITYLKKRLSHYVDKVHSISKYILARHTNLRYFINSKKYIIPNPYDGEGSPITNIDKITYGYIGRIHPTKGLKKMLHTISNYLSDTNTKIKIAGSTDNEHARIIKRQFRDLPVEFLGYTNKKSFFDMVDVVIIPSIWAEPFGRVAVEAIAHCRPVIASDMGGLPEIVNQAVGWTYNPDDPNELLNLIKDKVDSKSVIDKSYNCLDERQLYKTNRVTSLIEDMYKGLNTSTTENI